MATVTGVGTWVAKSTHRKVWSALGSSDTGTDFIAPNLPIKTVTVTGTWGTGGALVIEGSEDGSNYNTLNSNLGVALSLTANGTFRISENPKYIRPRATGGDGTTALNVAIESVG